VEKKERPGRRKQVKVKRGKKFSAFFLGLGLLVAGISNG
jgi:4-hydroxybenzoate polyprenyltransferase